jgi:hypothetical protein
MVIRARIRCINKTNRAAAHDRISHFGGQNDDGGRWKLSQAEAVSGVKSSKYSFYVEQPAGHVVNVIVARSAHGNEYLKTISDGEHPNNLLSLPECP